MSDTPKASLIKLSNLLTDLEQDATTRHEAREAGIPLGAISGFPKIDRELNGAFAPGLHVLHGAPGTGKSALALQIAGSCGCPCLYLTAEMAPLECFRRHIARTTQTYLGKFKSGELHPKEVLRLARKAVETAPYLTLVDATTAPASISDLADFAEITRKQSGGGSHLLIVVDSVHSWVRGYSGEAEEYIALNEGLKGLRELAQRLNAAVLGIGERNRLAMKSGGLNASAGSRMFEYSAETVLDLDYWDEAKKEDSVTGEKRLKVTFSKNRNGSAGKTLSLTFKGGFQTFTETI